MPPTEIVFVSEVKLWESHYIGQTDRTDAGKNHKGRLVHKNLPILDVCYPVDQTKNHRAIRIGVAVRVLETEPKLNGVLCSVVSSWWRLEHNCRSVSC
jgi:hypothetical protein